MSIKYKNPIIIAIKYKLPLIQFKNKFTAAKVVNTPTTISYFLLLI